MDEKQEDQLMKVVIFEVMNKQPNILRWGDIHSPGCLTEKSLDYNVTQASSRGSVLSKQRGGEAQPFVKLTIA